MKGARIKSRNETTIFVVVYVYNADIAVRSVMEHEHIISFISRARLCELVDKERLKSLGETKTRIRVGNNLNQEIIYGKEPDITRRGVKETERVGAKVFRSTNDVHYDEDDGINGLCRRSFKASWHPTSFSND